MAGTPKHRLSLRDVLTDGRIALMLPLGFSSGLAFPARLQHALGLAAGGGDLADRDRPAELGGAGLFLQVSLGAHRRPLRCAGPVPSARPPARLDGAVADRHGAGPDRHRLQRSAVQPAAHRRRSPARRLRIGDAGCGHRRLAHRRRRHRAPGHDGGLLSARLSPGPDLRRRGRALHRGIRELAQRLSGHGGADGRRSRRHPARAARRRERRRASICPSLQRSSSRSPICSGARA